MTPTKRTQAHADMATRTYGVEIETYGLGIERAARVVAEVLGGTVEVVGGYYGTVAAVAPDGRRWLAMSDGSILGSGGAEVVSPILRGTEDLETLQRVVRALRAAGARSDAAHQCGIHVHVGLQGLDVATIGRVAKTTAKLDGFIRRAVGVSGSRARWCLPLASGQVEALGRARTLEALQRAWYGTTERREIEARVATHYDQSRYRGLNLHSMFYRARGTAEFRYFDGTLHAGRVKSYVQLCLALVAKAATTTAASSKARVVETAAQASCLLNINLGMVGPEYATARLHLTAAWSARAAARTEQAA